ncbi:MAG: glycosyltransferase family 4 protein [Nitrospinae bacterium]|nr:glycosyltransferase family 4 protein [Nitrospinota bacterium]
MLYSLEKNVNERENSMADQTDLKVTVLTTSFPRFKGDNAGRFVCKFANELSLLGVIIKVIAPHDSKVVPAHYPFIVKHFRYFFPESMQSLVYGAGIASRIKNNIFRIFQFPFLMFSFFLAARKNSGETHIFHSYWTFAGLVAMAVKMFNSTPVVINLWGSDILFLKVPVLWPLLCRIFNKADAIVCESEHFAEQLIEKGIFKERIHICRNGIDLEKFKVEENKFQPKELQLPLDCPLILAVGNLSERKGHNYLLAALPRILADYGPVKLVIVGEGEFRDSLESNIEKRGLEKHVSLVGFQSEENIPSWLNLADIFVLPSLLEGTPNILLEAMACKLPILTTDVGGIGSVIKDGYNGIIIPPRSESKLAEGVISLLQDPDLCQRLAVNAQSTLHSQYGNWKKQASVLKTLYSQVLEKKNLS